LELEKKISYFSDQAISQGDVVSALESLGYKTADLRPLLGKIPSEHTTLDAQIKWLLQQLAK
jgi:Holliday junction resolvasome RuvABC DNA-binding subunit